MQRLFTKITKTSLNRQIKFDFSKVVNNVEEALQGVQSGQTILVGGFGLCGSPQVLLEGIKERGYDNLTVVSNNAGVPDYGIGILMQDKQIKKMYASYVGENKLFESQYLDGDLEVELTPQGTLAEKVRAGGAGIPAFFTPTGAHTYVETGENPIKYEKGSRGTKPILTTEPKERRQYNGRDYILEESITGDVSIIRCWKADTDGNLIFRTSSRNFNDDMCTASKLVIVEAEEIVPVGELDPDHVHVPSIYVDRILKVDYTPRIERVKNRIPHDPESEKNQSKSFKIRERIVKRVCKEVHDGMYVNLGIGIPVLVPAYLDHDVEIKLHSENGVLGVGDYPEVGEEHYDLINAAKETVTLDPGASSFSSSTSFGMVRGGHLDLTILGAMQVSVKGSISNWIIPGKMVKGMGGAMDLVSCGSKVIVAMEHAAKDGSHKLLNENTLPFTGKKVVDMVVTELAVFKNIDGKMTLTEISKDTTFEEVKAKTGYDLSYVNENELIRF